MKTVPGFKYLHKDIVKCGVFLELLDSCIRRAYQLGLLKDGLELMIVLCVDTNISKAWAIGSLGMLNRSGLQIQLRLDKADLITSS